MIRGRAGVEGDDPGEKDWWYRVLTDLGVIDASIPQRETDEIWDDHYLRNSVIGMLFGLLRDRRILNARDADAIARITNLQDEIVRHQARANEKDAAKRKGKRRALTSLDIIRRGEVAKSKKKKANEVLDRIRRRINHIIGEEGRRIQEEAQRMEDAERVTYNYFENALREFANDGLGSEDDEYGRVGDHSPGVDDTIALYEAASEAGAPEAIAIRRRDMNDIVVDEDRDMIKVMIHELSFYARRHVPQQVREDGRITEQEEEELDNDFPRLPGDESPSPVAEREEQLEEEQELAHFDRDEDELTDATMRAAVGDNRMRLWLLVDTLVRYFFRPEDGYPSIPEEAWRIAYNILEKNGIAVWKNVRDNVSHINDSDGEPVYMRRQLWKFIYDNFREYDQGVPYLNCRRFYEFVQQMRYHSDEPGFKMQLLNLWHLDSHAKGIPLDVATFEGLFIPLVQRVFCDGEGSITDVGRCSVNEDGDTLNIIRNPNESYILIRDFKVIMILFLMYFMGNPNTSPLGRNQVFYEVAPNRPNIIGRLFRNAGDWVNQIINLPLMRVEGWCHFGSFIRIFDQLYSAMKGLVFGANNEYNSEWEESESGDVYLYLGGSAAGNIVCILKNENSGVVEAATKWKDKYKKMLEEIFPDGGYLTVMNKDDDLCFLYVLAVAICRSKDRGFLRRPERFFLPETICTAVQYDNGDADAVELVSEIIVHKDSKRCAFYEEKLKGLYSLQDFVEVMERIEDLFVPGSYRIDVSLLDPGRSKRLYPVYNSKRDGTTLSFFMIRDGTDSHFCLITEEPKIWKATKGKLFQTCSVCHQSFFSQKLLDIHECRNPKADKRWHWSDVDEHDESECVGMCERCHLQFCDEYEFEHHKDHCFMRGRRGNRYIHLPEEPYLHGQEEKESSNPVDRVLFADFECMISPETGEHSFMSYGLYDVNTAHFKIGFSMEEFMDVLTEYATAGKHMKVYFHNAMGYDANFILRHVLTAKEKYKDWGIRTIMKSSTRMERLSFMFRTVSPDKKKRTHIIEIGDTLHFIGMSLDKIVKSVKKETSEENKNVFPLFFREFSKAYPDVSEEDINRILKKNLFPYNFFQKPDDLNCPMSIFRHIFEPLSPNVLNFSETVTISDLAANKPEFDYVVETFKCKSARDYHNLYLLCDVMQIADVFLQMREIFKEVLRIDLNDYMGMPSAAWAAFLRFNPSLKLPLYKSVWFQEFFNLGTRGGVTLAPKRYGKSTPTMSYIYWDKNGLYPDEMVKRLYPCGEMIRRVFVDDMDPFIERKTTAPMYNPLQCTAQSYLTELYFPWLEKHQKGCFISVDLHITKELAERTDQFPFAPDHVEILDDYFDETGEYYEFLKRWSDANDGEEIPKFKGLVATMYDKKEYHVHWRLLWWYIKHGMQVTKIHECVEFDESDYMKGFIERNIRMRNMFTDPMHKMLWKLPSNATYGKTFENTLNRANYVIVRNRDTLRGLIESQSVLSIAPIDAENCVVRIDGDEVVLDKPTYIGACITEYAKLSMYEAFYDQLPKMFSKVELIYTDTDSFIVGVEHPEGWGAKEIFDHIEKCCPGFMGSKGGQWKSETGDDLIDEVIALRSKVYAYKTKSGKIGKRAKGTTAAAQQKELDWETYKRALIELRAIPVSNVMFRRDGFKISTEEMMKRALSGNDGKRIIEPDGIHTHAIGYSRFFK